MADINALVEQHIREHESRLKHVDELLGRVHKVVGAISEDAEAKVQLAELQRDRDRLASQLEMLRLKPLSDWKEEEIEKAGPMGIWDAIAQQLEKLVERIER
jgi:hypothetical protein